ncbi:Kojibiose phosphorylase [Enterobacter cloacae]|uniref:Kojibiose phosphorylase n=1 Tax=Enterobacter cloacae TaxID=550 RepID=A0A377LYV9_ENTCL|nr:Kojibiose phosphorylase [Enterobacter cloacae]
MLNLSVLNDPGFCPHSLNKYASIMACGNGYMGIRAAHEENYTQQNRGMYLAGLYHRAGRNETNELINVPDIIGMDIELDGINFTLLSGEIIDWQRELDFANGELRRRVVWRSADGKRYRVESRRFVSLDQLPLVAMQLSVTPLDASSDVMLSTGIDATQTNSGRQHLDEISVRVFDQHYMQGVYETQDRAADVVISACCRLSTTSDSCFTAKNRRITVHHAVKVAQGDTVTLEKLVWVTHRSDKALSQDTFARNALAELKTCATRGYAALLESAACAWKKVWHDCRVDVTSTEHQDQLALDYAVWHLTAMTPAHDERSSIAAKGLTGEGYKGHVFWDTEISCCLSISLPDQKLPVVCCATGGLTCRGRGKKHAGKAGLAPCSPGRVPRAVRKRRRNSQRSTSARAYVRKWPPRWLNIISWRISRGPLSPTGRQRTMMPLCAMKA